MAMESVRMGRIPKKVKEKALRNYYKQHEINSHHDQKQLEDTRDGGLFNNDALDDSETDYYSLPSVKGESISSLSSFSSSSTSSMNIRQSIHSDQDIAFIPQSK